MYVILTATSVSELPNVYMAAASAMWSEIASHKPYKGVSAQTSDDLFNGITFGSITRTHINHYLNRLFSSKHSYPLENQRTFFYDQSRLTRPKDSCIRVC